jgi:hypothetical protein
MTDPVHLGDDVTLYCGLAEWRFLRLHMARLAQTNQILKNVCLLCRWEFPEWALMMHRNRGANMFSATLASPIVSFNRQQSSLAPSTTSIGSGTTNPKGMILSSQVLMLALARAIFWCPVLSNQPRFYTKLLFAVSASEHISLYPRWTIRSAYLLRCKSISWAQPLTEFVSWLKSIPHMWSLGLVPFATTGKATKPCSRGTVRLYRERLATYFANLVNHLSPPRILYTIKARRANATGTTDIARARIEQAQREMVQGSFV